MLPVSKLKDDPMTLNREHFLITLCMLLMISLFTPQIPQSVEQWLTALMVGSLAVVVLMLIRGCRRFMLE